MPRRHRGSLVVEVGRHMQNVVLCFATGKGGTTLDRDRFGGNPFASAFVENIAEFRVMTVNRLLERIRTRTRALSKGHQEIDVECQSVEGNRFLVTGRAVVLVLICSSYINLPVLSGAAFDKRRISMALAKLGYSVIQNSGDDLNDLQIAIRSFARLSRQYDTAIIYCTGHGLQWRKKQFLLPGNTLPVPHLNSRNAISIRALQQACHSRCSNAVFFAGCRNRN